MIALDSFVWALIDFIGLQLLHFSLWFLLFYPLIYIFRRFIPTIAMALCWLLVMRLVVPVELAFPWDVMSLFRAEFEIVLPALNYFGPISANGQLQTSGAHAQSFSLMALIAALILVWMLLASYKIYRVFISRKRLLGIARQANPLGESLQTISSSWRQSFGIMRKVRVVSSEQVGFVYTIGSFRPYIVLPVAVVEKSSPDELNKVIAHEFAHIKRFDDFCIVFLACLRAVFFFFPLIHICLNTMSICREKLCDREVLSRKIFSPYDYANCLLTVSSYFSPVGSPGAVAQFGGLNVMKERIRYFENKDAVRKTRPLLSSLVMVFAALLLLPLNSQSLQRSFSVAELVFVSPIQNAKVSSRYGMRVMPAGPNKGKQNFHRGLDFAASAGTPVYAVSDGVVLESVDEFESSAVPAYGKYLIVQHAQGMQSRYMHLQSLKVEVGDRVLAGQVIGKVGSSGLATGPHLHFELISIDEPVNPESYFDVVQ